MDAELITDPAEFEAAGYAVLEADPVRNTVPATLLERWRQGEPLPPTSLWVVVRDGAGVAVGVACQAPPYPLFVGPVPPGTEDDAARALVDAYLAGAGGAELSGVNGGTAISAAVAARYQERTGRRRRVVMEQLSYRLTDLVDPEPVAGQPRRATRDDLGLLGAWMDAFHAEVDPTAPREDNHGALLSRMNGGAVVVWERDGEPVGVAGLNPPAAGAARVGPVYTPPSERRKGIAANVTAAATRIGFELGAQVCMLYTDAANPTSNGVYVRLGYQLVETSTRWRFDA